MFMEKDFWEIWLKIFFGLNQDRKYEVFVCLVVEGWLVSGFFFGK